MDKYQWMKSALEEKKATHLFRQLREVDLIEFPYYQVDGQKQIMLSSNDYLNFSHHEQIKQFAKTIIDRFPTGSSGARLITGTSSLHTALEKALARFKKTEAALIFNTGYMANVGVLQGICDNDMVIFSDALNHASIVDGCRLTRAEVIIYSHNDMIDLERKIKERRPAKGLIVTDSVFSMDGDIADLPAIMRLGEEYQLLTMIDEAHATGVIGPTGQGACEHFALAVKPDIIVGTMSKALGCEGGFVCGSQLLIDYLMNYSRSFIFSTALSPLTIACALEALTILSAHPELVNTLQANVRCFCRYLKEHGVVADSQSAIVPILIGDAERTLQVVQKLHDQGIFVSGIRYPTVAKGRAMLRCTLSCNHQKSDLYFAAQQIAQCITNTLPPKDKKTLERISSLI